jgi:hypothetical protein
MTPAIHAENQSSTGERFLKFEMHENTQSKEDKLDSALAQMHHEAVILAKLGDIVAQFLSREVTAEKMIKIPPEHAERLKAMAKLIALLRAQVERNSGYERELRYRPEPEVPTRVLKQLAKLGQMICWVWGLDTMTDRVMKLLLKVTLNTCTGYHIDIVRTLIRTGNKGMTTRDLITKSNINHRATLANRMMDLQQLGIVAHETAPDPLNPGPQKQAENTEVAK